MQSVIYPNLSVHEDQPVFVFFCHLRQERLCADAAEAREGTAGLLSATESSVREPRRIPVAGLGTLLW